MAYAVTQTSIRDLDDAIKAHLGEDVYKALLHSHSGRCRMHEMACLAAFASKVEGSDVEVLRGMWRELKQTGQYPRAAWTGGEDKHG